MPLGDILADGKSAGRSVDLDGSLGKFFEEVGRESLDNIDYFAGLIVLNLDLAQEVVDQGDKSFALVACDADDVAQTHTDEALEKSVDLISRDDVVKCIEDTEYRSCKVLDCYFDVVVGDEEAQVADNRKDRRERSRAYVVNESEYVIENIFNCLVRGSRVFLCYTEILKAKACDNQRYKCGLVSVAALEAETCGFINTDCKILAGQQEGKYAFKRLKEIENGAYECILAVNAGEDRIDSDDCVAVFVYVAGFVAVSRKNVCPCYTCFSISRSNVYISDKLCVACCRCECSRSKVYAEETVERIGKVCGQEAAESLNKCACDGCHHIVGEDHRAEEIIDDITQVCVCLTFDALGNLFEECPLIFRLRGVCKHGDDYRSCLVKYLVKTYDCIVEAVDVVEVNSAEELVNVVEYIDVVGAGKDQYDRGNKVLDCVRVVENVVNDILDVFVKVYILQESLNEVLDVFAVFRCESSIKKCYKSICRIAGDILKVCACFTYTVRVSLLGSDGNDAAVGVLLGHLRGKSVPVEVE